ncbi:30569_t:CDS:2 [Gigaspora margarita]|uniref:30569_t:CDS:1 n=1 Tax=Gigaspora margarita TaxID=4874 RepID=A0ABN7UFS5_GIGMA|nr:30569_t:CDS:2 [Gigaspora margarita]
MNNLKLDPNIPIKDQDIFNKQCSNGTWHFKATKLHQALKLSNKARKLISSSPIPKSTQAIIDKINAILQQIDELADYLTSLIAKQNL